MKLITTLKLIVLNALVAGSMLAMPPQAQANAGGTSGGIGDGGGGDIVVWDIVDSVADDHQAVSNDLTSEGSGEDEDTAPMSQPEYKYVPVRR